MQPFRYRVAGDVPSAVALVADEPGGQYLAAGTSQVDLMKEGVQRPSLLVDVSRLGLDELTPNATGGLRIGAGVTNAVAADAPLVRDTYPAISEALHAGASQQIRNVASMAGNPLQRTRCPYLRDPAAACNKRDPGSGCAAVQGFNRLHAIFGATDEGAKSASTCIATQPSDLAVALAAHEAVLHVTGPDGTREIPFEDLHREVGDDPARDTTLAHAELITTIELPSFGGTSHYVKVRDRASYAYALVSCAAVVTLRDGRIDTARVALGGVAHKPWRARAAEDLLAGREPGEALFAEAAAAALDGARTYPMNAYKPALARAVVARALGGAAGTVPLPGPAGTVFAASVGGIAGVHS